MVVPSDRVVSTDSAMRCARDLVAHVRGRYNVLHGGECYVPTCHHLIGELSLSSCKHDLVWTPRRVEYSSVGVPTKSSGELLDVLLSGADLISSPWCLRGVNLSLTMP